VVYSTAEIGELIGKSPEAIRAIHKAKRALDGEMVTEPVPEDGSDEEWV
jgi:hypothetical protein